MTIDNLGTRQRALNERVNHAFENKINFDEITREPEANDIDKLFKIDLACKYKNIDYIIDILKSGDSLYTSRVLKKCLWLYDDEFSNILNPTYLLNNVFPFTSMKMKRKIINVTASHVTNSERASEFFQYCVKEKMKSALTCLLYTTDDFKLNQLRNNSEFMSKSLRDKDITYFRFLIGKSFDLLTALLDLLSCKSETALQFKNFFSISEEKYLEIAEKYLQPEYHNKAFDPKLSDGIMKRHKHRVLAKPKFYINIVDIDVLIKNSSADEIQIYAAALLPETAEEFWTGHESRTIEESRVFAAIPREESYRFFKNYFNTHYSNAEFETHPGFYKYEYYKFLTNDQQEEWAISQLKSEKQLLGTGRDFLYYKCINFKTAFDEIKRYINITTDAKIRNEMVQVLIFSAKADVELETLFKYYIKRHNKESEENREKFLDIVLTQHNVFEFEKNTWLAFYELIISMTSMDMISLEHESYARKQRNDNYKTIAILYNILHENEMPEELLLYLLDHFSVYSANSYLDKIKDKKKQQMLHDYFFTFYMNEITASRDQTFSSKHFSEVVESKLSRYFENIDASMDTFNDREKEKSEEGVRKRNQRRRRSTNSDDYDIWKYDKYEGLGSKCLLRDLKKNKDLVISKLSDINLPYAPFSKKEYNAFLAKIKIYFPDDVSKIYLGMFPTVFLKKKTDTLSYRPITKEMSIGLRSGVSAIFQLAEEDTKTVFIKKYFSNETQADSKQIDAQDLLIQRFICRHACSSRPPISVPSMATYMTAGGMKFCLPVLNKYLADLPLPICLQLVYSLTDTPVSIQKHAIRLAFQCFTPEQLKKLSLSLWKNTQNVTLRSILYRALYTKVADTKEKGLYDILRTFTHDLNQDDEDSVFEITVSEETVIPEEFLGEYISIVWKTVNEFKEKEPNITRKIKIINYIPEYTHLISEDFLSTLVNQHIAEMFDGNKLELTYSNNEIGTLYKSKWSLTAHYIIHFACTEDNPIKYVREVQSIVKRLAQNWDDMAYGVQVYKQCSLDFFNELKTISLDEQYGDIEDTIPIFQALLDVVEANLKFYDIYSSIWEFQLILITAKLMKQNRKYCKKKEKLQLITDIIKGFGKGVGQLVSELVGKNQYFLSYSPTIKNKITKYAEHILELIYEELDNPDDFDWDEYLKQSLITLAFALVEFELVETYLLAVMLLPTNCVDNCSDTYIRILNKLQEVPNAEVQLYLQEKFKKYCNKKDPLKNIDAPCTIN